MNISSKSLLFLFLLFISVAALGQTQTGIASFYADKFEGRLTASGEKYKHNKLTAAHKFLPFGTKVEVKNLKNNETVVVTINDRGPFVEGRIIDLSRSAAEKLKFTAQGLTEVEIKVVDPGDGKKSNTVVPNRDVVTDITTYFELETEKVEPSGFGVQVASFSNYANALQLSENLQKSYKEDVLVEVKKFNDNTVYALIIGASNNRKKAGKLLLEVKERFPDAFIKTLDQ